MARAEVCSGICGFVSVIEAKAQGFDRVLLSIESECQAVQRLAAELAEVQAIHEISFRGDVTRTHQLAVRHLPHAACPVPTGIIKAVEIAAGLALPVDVIIRLSKDEEAL